MVAKSETVCLNISSTLKKIISWHSLYVEVAHTNVFFKHFYTERHSVVLPTTVSCPRSLGLKFRPEDQISGLTFIVIFLTPFRQMMGWKPEANKTFYTLICRTSLSPPTIWPSPQIRNLKSVRKNVRV